MPSESHIELNDLPRATQGQRAEEDRANMEARYRGLLEASPDAMVVMNQDAEIVLLNARAEKQFGYHYDELLGQKVQTIIPKGFTALLLAEKSRIVTEALAQPGGIEIELCGMRKDGTCFPIGIVLSPLEDPEGTLITGAIREIPMRKSAEAYLIQMEARYRGLLEASPDAMVVVNQAGEIVLLNAQVEKQFGYHRDELLGCRVQSIIPKGFAARLIADGTRSTEEALVQQIGAGIELEGMRKDGSHFPIEIMLSLLESPEGILITAAIRNITVRKEAEKHLVQMEARYRGLLEAAPDAMVVVNRTGKIVLLNAQAEKQFGYHRDELVGRKVQSIIPKGFAARLIADKSCTATEVLAHQIGMGLELKGMRKDGSEFPIEIMLSPLESPEGILITAAIRDITLRKNAEEHLARMMEEVAHSAQHDPLTGLPNRLLLNDRLGQAIALAQRHRTPFAVLFLDLDGFKRINDSLGHSTGDKLLQSIAERLRDSLRAPDTVSRQGGDEFTILLFDAHTPEDVAIAARRVLQAVAGVHSIDGHALHITASIGVSMYPEDGLDAETLIKNADTAMYEAKENGCHGYKFFRPAMNDLAVERQSIEEDLRFALERKEFALHYQPKVDLKTGAITGAEALIRWTHPTRGSVPPLKFISVAEGSHLILPIGAWVLREACTQARSWIDAGLPKMTLAVNVSAVQFLNEDFLEGLFATLCETGLPPECLELEVTESVLMKDAGRAASILKTLREAGVQLSVDDFGTGFSSLSYLTKLPLDTLKIDQSFIFQIDQSDSQKAIVSAIIDMCRSLKLRVIAEGVETEEDLSFLKAYGCDEGQGYYFSRPVPPEQFVHQLSANAAARLCN
jgi:diguanylate cyclase (GGDEF)-like protein/PAS domain S-box-containing protein